MRQNGWESTLETQNLCGKVGRDGFYCSPELCWRRTTQDILCLSFVFQFSLVSAYPPGTYSLLPPNIRTSCSYAFRNEGLVQMCLSILSLSKYLSSTFYVRRCKLFFNPHPSIYVLIKERERERDTNVGVRGKHWLGIEPATFWCMGQCSNQLSPSARAEDANFHKLVHVGRGVWCLRGEVRYTDYYNRVERCCRATLEKHIMCLCVCI